MKILLLGAGGQVGYELLPLLQTRAEIVALAHQDIDLRDTEALEQGLARIRPNLIVNAAAYNEVDKAESEPDVALAVNARAVGVLGAYAARERGALVHYSTDFVFDGKKGAPYVETDPPNPLSAYARSKLEGEVLLSRLDAPAIVLRTAWVYSLRRKSFVSLMLKLARERTELRIVTDQVGSPTFARDLARVTARLIEQLGEDPHDRAKELAGVYHAAGGGACSRYELARAAIELDPKKGEHVVQRILAAKAADFPAPATRPSYAPLDCSKLRERLGLALVPWRDALKEAVENP